MIPFSNSSLLFVSSPEVGAADNAAATGLFPSTPPFWGGGKVKVDMFA